MQIHSKRFAKESARRSTGFRDPALPLQQRADDLLARLTRGEKIAMLHQYAPAIPRLGLAPFRTGSEVLHGLAWQGPATVFPQAIGLATSWNPDLVAAVAAATSAELRALHHDEPTVSLNGWAPVVNLLRDPRWGRNEEGYSEDPLLTARLAIAFGRGLRGDDTGCDRVTPVLKHFLAYNNEAGRDTTSSVVRARVLHEYDFRPFREPIQAGTAGGVMPSYNLVNGRPNHVSPYLNQYVRAWAADDDDLVVCSDALAPSNLVETEHYFDDHPSAHAAALKAGVDSFTDNDADPSFTIANVTEALRRELISERDVNAAVRRLLLMRLRHGEFDTDGGRWGRNAADAVDYPAHRELAAGAAREAIVLLKNEGGLLPLTPEAGTTVAVIGPLADTLRADWYSGTMPYQVTVAAGLREALAATGAEVTVEEGLDGVVIGDPERGAGSTSRNLLELGEFKVADWGENLITLRSAATGRYLTVKEDGSLAADQERPNGWVTHETFTRVAAGESRVLLRSAADGHCVAAAEVVTDGIAAAVAAASAATSVVLVVGNDPLVGARETTDRSTLALPPGQEKLIRAVADANPRTVLVIMSSFPYSVTWARDHVAAIVWTCHGGQETGHAVADVLLGHPPAGRLTQTWHRADTDLPGILDYDIIKSARTYLYDFRAPLFPFGHGLSYTTFAYAHPRLNGAPAATASVDDSVLVTVRVTNTGQRAGTEVVQVYARARLEGLAGRWARDRPRRQLCGFTRVRLEPGETGEVRISVPVSTLACWDVDAHRLIVPPGEYDLLVGASCADIRQAATLTVQGPEPGPRQVTDRWIAAADFDDYAGVTLVDATREAGDAVTPADPDRPGWILFRDVDLGSGCDPGWPPPEPGRGHRSVTFRVARAEPGEAWLEVTYAGRDSADPGEGRLLGRVAVPATGNRYAPTEVTVGLACADGFAGAVGDLYVVLRGAQRLASFRISS